MKSSGGVLQVYPTSSGQLSAVLLLERFLILQKKNFDLKSSGGVLQVYPTSSGQLSAVLLLQRFLSAVTSSISLKVFTAAIFDRIELKLGTMVGVYKALKSYGSMFRSIA